MHSYTQALSDPKRYSAKKRAVPVNLFCNAPEAASVCVAGDFNQWAPGAHPMARQVDGAWRCQIALSPGHHQYVFLVDGQAVLDPQASGVTRNERNERVSMIFVS